MMSDVCYPSSCYSNILTNNNNYNFLVYDSKKKTINDKRYSY